MTYWLWMVALSAACVIVTSVICNAFLPPEKALARGAFGQDFVAFYAAGRLVDTNRAADLYNLTALATLQHSIAEANGFRLAASVVPWCNPPFAAWPFTLLSRLSFYEALLCWTAFSIACLGVTAALLASLIRTTSERKRDWWLVPALLAVAPPTIQSLGHGQNSPLSLLLLTLVVLAWRSGRPMMGGLACAALSYKPQLALLVSGAMIATLGWRVLIGMLSGLVPLLLLTINTMPGALADFYERVPENLLAFRKIAEPLWHRQTTFEGFLRFIFDRDGLGSSGWIHAASLGCIAVLLGTLCFVGLKMKRLRSNSSAEQADVSFDRFVALIFLATPLSMPYFVDYDLLIMAVPAVLIAREIMIAPDFSRSARALRGLFPLTFIWLACNPVLAPSAGLNLTVPLLVMLCSLQAKRCLSSVVLRSTAATNFRATEQAFASSRLAA